jgi:hypothetical protein
MLTLLDAMSLSKYPLLSRRSTTFAYFLIGLFKQVAKKIGVRRPDVAEVKAFLKAEFEESGNIDKDDFVKTTRKWRALEKMNITKVVLKRIFNSIDKGAGK